jgi:hypothetical protein
MQRIALQRDAYRRIRDLVQTRRREPARLHKIETRRYQSASSTP